MTISTRERQLLRVVLVAILALIVSRFLWLPLVSQRRTAEAQLLEAEIRQQSVERNLAAREAVERNFAALQDQLQKTRSNEEELSVFLRTLNQMLTGLSLRIGQIRALPSEVQPTCKKHTVQIEVTGLLSGLSRLLAEVSLSKLPIRVERLELAGDGTDGRVDGTLWISELILLEQPGAKGGDL
jgi:Tfp pilus assembly protein PilO